jgi:hypothetical protein
MIAIGFGLSEFRKVKANPREVLPSHRGCGFAKQKKGVTDENNSFFT